MSKDRQKRPAVKDEEAAMDDRTGESKTEFFRQPQAWEVLEEKVIAPLVEKAEPGSEIRVWVPGCSTGKEAYSLAMVLAEEVEEVRQEGGDPDLRHRLGCCRSGDGPERQLFEGRDRGEHLGRAAEAVFYAQGRPLPDRQGDAGAGRFRSAEPHGRPALLEAGPDQLPQPPDLPGPGGAEEDHRPVSFRAAGRGISVSGHCRDGRRPGGSFRGRLEEMADLSPHRRRPSRGRRNPAVRRTSQTGVGSPCGSSLG